MGSKRISIPKILGAHMVIIIYTFIVIYIYIYTKIGKINFM